MLLLKTPSFARLLTLTNIKDAKATVTLVNNTMRKTIIPVKNSPFGMYSNYIMNKSFGRSVSNYFFSSKY